MTDYSRLAKLVEKWEARADEARLRGHSGYEYDQCADELSTLIPDAGCRWPTQMQKPAKNGQCCGCGYSGEEESECPAYYDQQHCNHWWDGKDGD